LPVEHALQRLGLRDVEVVAGDEPDPGAALGGREHGGLEQFESAVLDEGRNDRDLVRPGDQRPDVREKRVLRAANDERRRGHPLVVALPRNGVADSAPRIVHVTLVARDDMDV
jgi:hypothetical protein